MTGIAPVSPGVLQGILLFELRCPGSEPNRTAVFRLEQADTLPLSYTARNYQSVSL